MATKGSSCGRGTMRDPLLAIHQAGHAVMAVLQGVPVRRVAIDDGPDARLACARRRRWGEPLPAAEERWLRVALAGYLAERDAAPLDPELRDDDGEQRRWEEDVPRIERQLANLVTAAAPDTRDALERAALRERIYCRVTRETSAHLQAPAVAAAIAEVATRLVRRGVVSGRAVREILRHHQRIHGWCSAGRP
jgi:hypothetical protein